MLDVKEVNMLYLMHQWIEQKTLDQNYGFFSEFDADSIAEKLLEDTIVPQNKYAVQYVEVLGWFIELCSYIEEETTIPSIISDEVYDKLVERLIDLGETQPIGSPTSNIVGIGDRPHQFPELRGSLAKVHFIHERDIPKKDSRKSLEGYLRKLISKMEAANIPIGIVPISVDMKRDGVSHIIEGHEESFDHVLTRGDVANNMGKDLTPIFSRFFPKKDEDITKIDDSMVSGMNLNMLPTDMWKKGNQFGIKVETYMKTDKFEEYKEDFHVKRCNRRSAVTSICNQSPENITPNIPFDATIKEQYDYLEMDHFQIASTKEIQLDEGTLEMNWVPIGKINERYQYLYVEHPDTIDLRDLDTCLEKLSNSINTCQIIADSTNTPIDGAVISILDKRLIELLGRKDNKNMFQVAFKFPAGVEKTTIKSVDFQVGPIAGRITPVARLKPIKINGNTISNVTLANKDKMNRLKIHIGDEVIIKYDIVPTIFKDETCKEMNTEMVMFPEECPICGEPVENECCSNPDCPAKLVGHIMNYITKVDIKGGIGFETVCDFVDIGFLTCIGDLYRLEQLPLVELCSLPGYGDKSIESILEGISQAKHLYQHQILGSIGIPYLGLKTMEKLCRKVNIIGNLDNLEELVPEMVKISGIGPQKVAFLLSGIERKKSEIEDVCKYVTIKPYEKERVYKEHVCFSNTRDEDFETYLDSIDVKVEDSFVKSVGFLIIPDKNEKESTKMKTAKERGVPIITISDAKRKWNYEP